MREHRVSIPLSVEKPFHVHNPISALCSIALFMFNIQGNQCMLKSNIGPCTIGPC